MFFSFRPVSLSSLESSILDGRKTHRAQRSVIVQQRKDIVVDHRLPVLGAAVMVKIDFTRPNKFDSIAGLLFAITGKGIDSWLGN